MAQARLPSTAPRPGGRPDAAQGFPQGCGGSRWQASATAAGEPCESRNTKFVRRACDRKQHNTAHRRCPVADSSRSARSQRTCPARGEAVRLANRPAPSVHGEHPSVSFGVSRPRCQALSQRALPVPRHRAGNRQSQHSWQICAYRLYLAAVSSSGGRARAAVATVRSQPSRHAPGLIRRAVPRLVPRP